MRNGLNVLRLPAQTVISQNSLLLFLRLTVVVGFVFNFLNMKPWCDPGLTMAEMSDNFTVVV